MARVIYGVWDGVAYDHRHTPAKEMPDSATLHGVDVFDEGNPIEAFFGDKGFLVFAPDVNLVDALWRHMAKAAQESCGKCTPCRMGTRLMLERLDKLRQGEGGAALWQELTDVAEQTRATSLCGLGQTCAVALIGALKYFRDEMARDPAKLPQKEQNVLSYMTAPCIEACPSKVDVPRYISYLRDGKPTHALGVLCQRYPMAATCGRVCLHFCEMACRRNLVDEAVNIKTLKRFIADHQHDTHLPLFDRSFVSEHQPADRRVAVVGAGPAGLNCAYHLLLKGYPVDVYDAGAVAGGMAEHGIPSYRLPKSVLKAETEIIEALGGTFHFNQKFGRDFTLDDLTRQGAKAVFLGLGCAQGARLGAKGEDPSLVGYESGIDFLMKVHHHVDGTAPLRLYGDVVVVGGGNVAMDCVRSAIRLGADHVHLVYRRTQTDMPADDEEIKAAEQEGVIFHFLTNPTQILSESGVIKGVELVEMAQTEPDDSGRRGVKAKAGSEYTFPCATLIAAIGQQVDRDALDAAQGIAVSRYGTLIVNASTQETSRTGVFAGGDCSLGPSTLVHAMADGMNAARSIDDYLRYGKVRFSPIGRMREILNDNNMLASDCLRTPVISLVRVHHPELDPNVRRQMFEEVELSISREEAYNEAKRCMRCYRVYSLITAQPIPEIERANKPTPAAP